MISTTSIANSHKAVRIAETKTAQRICQTTFLGLIHSDISPEAREMAAAENILDRDSLDITCIKILSIVSTISPCYAALWESK